MIASVRVDPMGPPPVRSHMIGKSLKTQRMTNTRATPVTGRKLGKVMCQNCPHQPAPSIFAASYNSSEIACNPARSMTDTKGKPFQIITTQITMKAVVGDENQATGLSRMPIRTRNQLITPKELSNIHHHITAAMTAGIAHGNATVILAAR